MEEKILQSALQKFRQFSKKYDGFINVIVDNWRGYRFIFDTKDVRRCNNNCINCPLFQMLKNEKRETFSAGLYAASAKDKTLFGHQNFLNCKTLKQYQDCYINFLTFECQSKKEIWDELDLIKNLCLFYCKKGSAKKKEKQFKKEIIESALALTNAKKKEIIYNYLKLNPDFLI